MAMKPIGSFVGDGTPPRAGGKETSYGPLRAILNPERCKTWAAVRPAIEQLEDLVRRYEARRSASGTGELLSDDIKSASLELLVPNDLEKHLILNKNRLTTYELMRQEIELVVESSVGSKGSVTRLQVVQDPNQWMLIP